MQDGLSQIFKFARLRILSETIEVNTNDQMVKPRNPEVRPKPDPKENKFQIICVEQLSDEIDENMDFFKSDDGFPELTEFLNQSEEEIPEEVLEDVDEDFYWNHLEGPVQQWEILKSCIPEYREWKLIHELGNEYGSWRARQAREDEARVQGARRVPADEPGRGETLTPRD